MKASEMTIHGFAERRTSGTYDVLMRYWGETGFPPMHPTGVVLHISIGPTGEVIDWRAFIGSSYPGSNYEGVLLRVSVDGTCLTPHDAIALLGPEIMQLVDLPYRS